MIYDKQVIGMHDDGMIRVHDDNMSNISMAMII